MKIALALMIVPAAAAAAPTAKVERAVLPCSDADSDGKGKSIKVPGLAIGGDVGFVQTAVWWTDKTGDHVAVFWVKDKIQDQTECAVESRHLHADVYDVKAGKVTKLVRAVQEPAKACFQQSQTRFEPAFAVDDVDGDGIGELTFAYTVGCSKTGDKVARKLFVLEGGDKHVLRGDAVYGARIVPGKFEVEGFKNQAALLTAATATWKKPVDLD